MKISEIKTKVSGFLSNRKLVEKQLKELKKKKKVLEMQSIQKQKALEFVKKVANETQHQLEIHISEMVTSGLNSVFEEEYNFRVLFDLKKDRTECGLFFEKDGNLIHPVKFSGIGACDVAAFCLRCAAWSMDKSKRNVLILDEPFKHLKGDEENLRVLQLMKEMSHHLNLQIICINDERIPREDIISNSDKTFIVSKNNAGESKVKEVINK